MTVRDRRGAGEQSAGGGIEVILALPRKVWRVTLHSATPITAREALFKALDEDAALARALEQTGIDAVTVPIGVFGECVDDDRPLADGERLEVYRPLAQDPMTRRRRVARTSGKPRRGSQPSGSSTGLSSGSSSGSRQASHQ
ncbi:MAG: hypothetical protein CSB44_09000 [Gammaproteobacteria bacterium]|nr:MAG: hypothetical protein CSB44_09000 [Gammaproteobacteria bacterium]PIE36568.1 MAG: hypothetical protein CSA54_04105 [Gammaproteobacteria bacterium]